MLGLGIGGIALEQAIPLNRVWSFPKEIKRFVPLSQIEQQYRSGVIGRALGFEWYPAPIQLGDIVTVEDWPGRFVVTRAETSDLQLYSPEQRLILRGVKPERIEPILIGETIPIGVVERFVLGD